VHALLKKDGILFLSMPNADAVAWHFLNSQNANPYWGELEHYHNFGRVRLYQLLEENGFEPLRYGISSRYKVCMEIVARKRSS
jgi:predicted SAM-dependent methyltransferase